MSTWVFGAERWSNLIYYSLGGHKDVIVGCFFEKDSLDVSWPSFRIGPCYLSAAMLPTGSADSPHPRLSHFDQRRLEFSVSNDLSQSNAVNCVWAAVHGQSGRDAVCVGERHPAGRSHPGQVKGQGQNNADTKTWRWGGRRGRGHQRETWRSQRREKENCSLQANQQVWWLFSHWRIRVIIWHTFSVSDTFSTKTGTLTTWPLLHSTNHLTSWSQVLPLESSTCTSCRNST